jgi:hypothetical protein
VLRGLLELANFLKGQADVIEDTTVEDKVRKAGHERVPVEVKDPSGLARELIWRVRRELGEIEEVAPVDVKEEVKVKETKSKKKLESKMLPPASRIVGIKSRFVIFFLALSCMTDSLTIQTLDCRCSASTSIRDSPYRPTGNCNGTYSGRGD